MTPISEWLDLLLTCPSLPYIFPSFLSYYLPPNVKLKFKWASVAQQQPICVCQIIIVEQTLFIFHLFLSYSLEKHKVAFALLHCQGCPHLTLAETGHIYLYYLLEVCFDSSYGEQSCKKRSIWKVFEVLQKQNFKYPYYSCLHLIKIHLGVFVMV